MCSLRRGCTRYSTNLHYLILLCYFPKNYSIVFVRNRIRGIYLIYRCGIIISHICGHFRSETPKGNFRQQPFYNPRHVKTKVNRRIPYAKLEVATIGLLLITQEIATPVENHHFGLLRNLLPRKTAYSYLRLTPMHR